MSKPARWYEVVDGTAFIYDAPYPKQSGSVSIVPAEQLTYYKNNFHLRRVWNLTAPSSWAYN